LAAESWERPEAQPSVKFCPANFNVILVIVKLPRLFPLNWNQRDLNVKGARQMSWAANGSKAIPALLTVSLPSWSTAPKCDLEFITIIGYSVFVAVKLVTDEEFTLDRNHTRFRVSNRLPFHPLGQSLPPSCHVRPVYARDKRRKSKPGPGDHLGAGKATAQ
jgi:hypothetical protein